MVALGGLVLEIVEQINTPIDICLTAASIQLNHIEALVELIDSAQDPYYLGRIHNGIKYIL